MPQYGPADPEFAPETMPRRPRPPGQAARYWRRVAMVDVAVVPMAMLAAIIFGFGAGGFGPALIITAVAMLGFAMLLYIGNETWFAGGIPYLSLSLMSQPVPVDPMARNLKAVLAGAALLPLALGILLATVT